MSPSRVWLDLRGPTEGNQPESPKVEPQMTDIRTALFPALLVAVLAVSSCAVRNRATMVAETIAPSETHELQPRAPQQESAESGYLVRFGDRLVIQVAGHEDSRIDVLVRPDGRISLPNLGEVEVAGKTIPYVQEQANAAYALTYREPRSFVNVIQMAPERIYVFGEVQKPGIVESTTPLNILQVLAAAGGEKTSAELHSVILIDDLGNGEKRIVVLDVTSEEPAELLKATTNVINSFDIVIVPTRLISDVGQFVKDYIVTFLPPIDTYLRGKYYWTLNGGN